MIDELFDTRKRNTGRALDGVFLAKVSKTGDEVHFTIPELSRDQEFGPAPWPKLPSLTGGTSRDSTPDETADFAEHDHDIRDEAGDPPRGTECAVFFSGGDPNEPRVLCFYGWPA